MFSDPQSVTINSVAISLPRTSAGVATGAFQAADGTVLETVAHAYGKRARRTWRIQHSKVVPDPLVPAQNTPYSMTFYVVADVPLVGYSVAEQKQVIDGFITQLNASSGALITKFLGGES
jgi:hypothetical protein